MVVPSVDWGQSPLTLDKVRGWYARQHVNPPPLTDAEFPGFAMLMCAQVFIPHNPYGALNSGHRIDWDTHTNQLYSGSPAKQLGAFLREVMVINAVVQYAEAEGKPMRKEEGFVPRADTLPQRKNAKAVFAELSRDFVQLGYSLQDAERILLERIVVNFSVHIATSASETPMQLVINLIQVIKTLGVDCVNASLDHDPYGFQYFIHRIKSLSPIKFRIMFHHLNVIYGLGFARDLFVNDIIVFTTELLDINELWDNLKNPKVGTHCDIDGTALPVDELLPLLIELMRNGIRVSFNTGRPLPGVTSVMLNPMKIAMTESDFQAMQEEISLYVSNANEGMTAGGTQLYSRSEFSPTGRDLVRDIIADLGLEILSQKPYRLM